MTAGCHLLTDPNVHIVISKVLSKRCFWGRHILIGVPAANEMSILSFPAGAAYPLPVVHVNSTMLFIWDLNALFSMQQVVIHFCLALLFSCQHLSERKMLPAFYLWWRDSKGKGALIAFRQFYMEKWYLMALFNESNLRHWFEGSKFFLYSFQGPLSFPMNECFCSDPLFHSVFFALCRHH